MQRSTLYKRFGIAVAIILAIGALVVAASAQTNDQYMPFQRSEATIVMTDNGITVTPANLGPGPVTFIVQNNSNMVRGVVLSGADRSGSPVLRYSPRINPGGSGKVDFFLYEGRNYTFRDYISRRVASGGSVFQTSYSTQMAVPNPNPIGRGPTYEQKAADITITNNGIQVSPSQTTLGPVVFTIKNETNKAMGVIVSGQDRSGGKITRYSRVVRPGESSTMNFWLYEGRTYKIQDYTRRVVRGTPEYASRFSTEMTIQPASPIGM